MLLFPSTNTSLDQTSATCCVYCPLWPILSSTRNFDAPLYPALSYTVFRTTPEDPLQPAAHIVTQKRNPMRKLLSCQRLLKHPFALVSSLLFLTVVLTTSPGILAALQLSSGTSHHCNTFNLLCLLTHSRIRPSWRRTSGGKMDLDSNMQFERDILNTKISKTPFH